MLQTTAMCTGNVLSIATDVSCVVITLAVQVCVQLDYGPIGRESETTSRGPSTLAGILVINKKNCSLSAVLIAT